MDPLSHLPWYATVAFAIALAAISWFGGRLKRQREEASTDASVTGLKALTEIINTCRETQVSQAAEIDTLRRSLISEVSQIGRLRSRVSHLEALLRQAGIAVPPDDDGQPVEFNRRAHD